MQTHPSQPSPLYPANRQAAIQLHPNAPGYTRLGLVLASSGATVEAKRAIQRSIQMAPSEPEGYQQLAMLQGPPEAERTLRDGIQAVLDSAALSNQLAMALLLRNQTEEGLKVFSAAVHAAPSHAVLRNNHATALAKASRHGAAKMAFKKALELDPGLDDAYAGLAALHLEMEEFDESVAAYAALAERDKRYADYAESVRQKAAEKRAMDTIEAAVTRKVLEGLEARTQAAIAAAVQTAMEEATQRIAALEARVMALEGRAADGAGP